MRNILCASLFAASLQFVAAHPLESLTASLSPRDGNATHDSTTQLGLSPWPPVPIEYHFEKPLDAYDVSIVDYKLFNAHRANITPREIYNNLQTFRGHLSDAVKGPTFDKYRAGESFYLGDPLFRLEISIVKSIGWKQLPTEVVLHALDVLSDDLLKREVVAMAAIIGVHGSYWGNYWFRMDFIGLTVGSSEGKQKAGADAGLQLEDGPNDDHGNATVVAIS